ncbi:DNA mismatch repair endonuclease MutL [candidate division WOR-3 bacterium]|nr:DNA mismatch repair endonuclease MutL [candidate division WOR-3 bacterium]
MSIRVLSRETAAKIAAGEVIIRPASVVKELVENSLDAGAKKVEIYLEQGGKKIIRVADDGEGIPPDEVELAVRRFATSKLESVQDLTRIASYGFRGEALASMAEVCELKIETQTQDSEVGSSLLIKAGDIKEYREIVRAPGTTVTVQDLFFNLPARRAFLRNDSYETRLVLGAVRNYALLEPEIRFEIRSNRKILDSYRPSKEWIKRILDVLPQLKKVELISISQKHQLLTLDGFIVRPDQSGEVSKVQKTFFNGRPVLYRTVYRAIMEGFGPQSNNLVPFFVLKLVSPPEMLDSNIHPAKTEVRFRDERFLYDFVFQAVRKAIHREAVSNLEGFPMHTSASSLRPYLSRTTHQNMPATPQDLPQLTMPPTTVFSPSRPVPAEISNSPMELPDSSYSQTGFWQLQNTYILAQVSSGLIIVDQHAAHERILYEEMLEQLEGVPRQRLLFPLIVELTSEESATFEEISDYLGKLGLEAKSFGPNQVIVETLPADAKFGQSDLKELFREFNQTDEVRLGNRDKMAAIIACHGAIKAGHILSQPEMESLINRLFCCKTPYFCPHGRPTVIKFTMTDLDKRFGRF